MKIHFLIYLFCNQPIKMYRWSSFILQHIFFPKPKKMNKTLKNLQLSDQNASWTFQLLRLRLKSFFSPSLFFSSTGSIRNKRVSISEIQQHIKLLIRLNSSDFLSTINATKKLTRSLQPRRKMLRWIQFQIFCGKFYGFKFYKNA